MGILKGFGPGGKGEDGEAGLGVGEGHRGLGAGMYGCLAANMLSAGLPGRRGGGEGAYGEGGRKCMGDQPPGGPRPPGPPPPPLPDIVGLDY